MNLAIAGAAEALSAVPRAALPVQIPSPSTAVWHLGPLPIRAYALCIILGIVAACVITDRRMRTRGAPPWAVLDIAVFAVPFGIIGGRIYHVITSPQQYFGEGGHPIEALYIWRGGLGIWGAIALGALGAWLACKQMGLPFALVADSMAVGLPVAQAIGRLGNWFNNELYGGVTKSVLGLQIHPMDPRNPGHAELGPDGKALTLPDLYQPTFLYELVWDLLVALLVVLADRRFKLGRGRAFALYVMAYTAGRGVIETMRTDPANHFGGLRLNVWTSIVVFLAALAYFLLKPGPREYVIPNADGVKGYQVVTEAQYAAFAADGTRPEGTAPEAPAASGDGDGNGDGAGDGDADGDAAQSGPAGESAQADTAKAEKAEKG